jgi:hypothetical protein
MAQLSYAYAVQPFAIPTGVKLLVKVVLQTGQIDAPLQVDRICWRAW